MNENLQHAYVVGVWAGWRVGEINRHTCGEHAIKLVGVIKRIFVQIVEHTHTHTRTHPHAIAYYTNVNKCK